MIFKDAKAIVVSKVIIFENIRMITISPFLQFQIFF
jgi:hypothetical protein